MSKQELLKKIEKALDEVRPYLQQDGGDVNIVELTKDQVLKVKFVGACGTCEINTQTLKNGVEAAVIQHVPLVKKVISVD